MSKLKQTLWGKPIDKSINKLLKRQEELEKKDLKDELARHRRSSKAVKK